MLQALPHMDAMVLVAGVAATLLALLVAGLVPALQSARLSLRSAISAESGSVMPRWRGRRYLIAAQVMVSVVLVAVAMLYVGQLRRQSQMDTGIDLDHLALAQVNFGAARYDENRSRQLAAAILGRIATAPGVTRAAVTSGLPIGSQTTYGATLRPVGDTGSAFVDFTAATPGVFDALGVGITRGRAFDARDTASAPGVIVLSQQAAREVFGSDNVLGRQLIFERRMALGEHARPPATLTVIGLAADTDAGAAGRRDRGVAYLPLDQHYEANLVLAARTDRDPQSIVPSLRAAIAAVDSSLAVVQIGTGLALAGPDTMFPRIAGGFAGLLGSMALVLALAGLYGVLSHVVSARTREIGVRLAIGADASAIRRMVLREGLSPVLLGLVAGLGLSLIVRAALQPMFLRLVPAADVSLMLFVPALFIAAGLAACYVPAIRASRVDPQVALRNL
jgi:predicted permease